MCHKKPVALVLFLAASTLSFYTKAENKDIISVCADSNGQLIKGQTISNFNQTETGRTNFKSGKAWYQVRGNANPRLHDFIKVSFMTGAKVNFCMSGVDKRIFIIERAYDSN